MSMIEEVMMKNHKIIVVFIFLLCLSGMAGAVNNGGEVKLGYVFIDEEGNQSVNQPTFNYYPGFLLSLEKFHYNFTNGMRVRADLKNLTLNNRNLSLGLGKAGLFGIDISNNQYRRVYDFDGNSFTRRRQTGGSLWFFPHRYLKLFGGGSFSNLAGSITDLFNPDGPGAVKNMDYGLKTYHAGMRFNFRGKMLQAEYRTSEYTDNKNADRGQKRSNIKLDALLPVPKYEWIVLTGGFRHFETKYSTTEFKISSNRAWGGATAALSRNFSANYNLIFDRTGSDSDIIATDNLAHTIYLTGISPGHAGLTVGYQNDINDDFADEVRANSYYASGWFTPNSHFEFRGEFGTRAEKVEDGWRLVGNEDRNRLKISGKYFYAAHGSLSLKYENKQRDNDQLGTSADFNRFAADATLKLTKYGEFSGGYSYSTGDYKDLEQEFEFNDHVLYGDITLREYHRLRAGFGATYYRSKRDIDVESFMLHFMASLRFAENHHLEVVYNVHNFDDFLVTDRYYTANIVEINLIKELSF